MSSAEAANNVSSEYVAALLGHFTLYMSAMTPSEKAHSAGILANTFLTNNVTNDRDPYSVDVSQFDEIEQATISELFDAAGWGSAFFSSGMRRVSHNLALSMGVEVEQ